MAAGTRASGQDCRHAAEMHITHNVLQGLELLKDLLSIEVPLTLNEAFCDHHRKHCPKSEELDRECSKVAPPDASGLVACADISSANFGPCPDYPGACSCMCGMTRRFRMALRAAQLCAKCLQVEKDAAELGAALKKVQSGMLCTDLDKRCPEWAEAGECGSNP